LIDPHTFERFQVAQDLARHQGLALPEVLDDKRLLLTRSREHDIQVRTLEDLLRRLDRQSPNKIMAYHHGRIDGTPAEMFAAMRSWLETVSRNLANKTLEDV
jgi:hypothetical protein